ncbi:MAG: superoxide dismutase family protein [Bryocella sp.]
MQMKQLAAGLSVVLLAVATASAGAPKYSYPILNKAGQKAGKVTFSSTKKGVKVHIVLQNIGFGEHGVHIHQNAVCDAPDFHGAGGHFNPDGKHHGYKNPLGHHNGDMPANVSVGEDHNGEATFVLKSISLDPAAPNSIFANGGTSLVVHEKTDDEMTDPAGNAGNRIACAVIKQ